MLDFSLVRTPPGNADTLVLPPPADMARAARANAALLRRAATPLLDTTLADIRRQTRERIAGGDGLPVIVTGHQPGFMHPGVWAKHIVAQRLAAAVGGVAINIVVDSDAPTDTHLAIPTAVRGDLEVVNLPIDHGRTGLAYEEFPAWSADQIARFEEGVRRAMGDRYGHSLMPTYFEGFLTAAGARDWVAQAIGARRAIEGRVGVSVRDLRISEAWCGALAADLLLRAGQFREAYNAALAAYRRRYGVRSPQRPIPDLAVDNDAVESPIWVYASGAPRQRLFVIRRGEALVLRAENRVVAELSKRDAAEPARAHEVLAGLGVKLRPRALALTLWARLALADVFIHGIGGAKYDRITDDIIQRHYGLPAPAMGCVSATLRLPGLPTTGATLDLQLARRHSVHDVRCNPERHVPADTVDVRELLHEIEAATEAVRAYRSPARRTIPDGGHAGDRQPRRTADPIGRRRAYQALRDARAALHQLRPEALPHAESLAVEADRAVRLNALAHGREYFFGLFPEESLRTLLAALPAVDDFAV